MKEPYRRLRCGVWTCWFRECCRHVGEDANLQSTAARRALQLDRFVSRHQWRVRLGHNDGRLVW